MTVSHFIPQTLWQVSTGLGRIIGFWSPAKQWIMNLLTLQETLNKLFHFSIMKVRAPSLPQEKGSTQRVELSVTPEYIVLISGATRSTCRQACAGPSLNYEALREARGSASSSFQPSLFCLISCRAVCAAKYPHRPCTPPPGGVDDEQI